MILVDYREDSKSKGSRGLWDDLRKTDLPVEQTSLDAGDLMFVGNGPEGEEVSVGVEFKKIRDLVSSIRTKRFQGHQLPKLQQYDFRFLLIEGEWRHDERGLVTVRAGAREWRPIPGQMAASELDKALLGYALRGGLLCWPTHSRRETVRWIESLYRNFTDCDWDEHGSHVAIYHPPTLVPVSDFRKTVNTFPGIGTKTSLHVEKHFGGSLRRAVKAGAKEWEKIEGVGSKGAERIDDYLN